MTFCSTWVSYGKNWTHRYCVGFLFLFGKTRENLKHRMFRGESRKGENPKQIIQRHTWNALVSDHPLSLPLQVFGVFFLKDAMGPWGGCIYPGRRKRRGNLSLARSRFRTWRMRKRGSGRDAGVLLHRLVQRIREFIASVMRCTPDPICEPFRCCGTSPPGIPVRQSFVLRHRDIRLSTSIIRRPWRLRRAQFRFDGESNLPQFISRF